MIEESLTTENINAAKEHATQENIEAGASAAWEGLKWADKKADEHGVDKMAVAQKAGSATWNAASKIDYGKLAENL